VPPGYYVNTNTAPPHLAKCSSDTSTGQGYFRSGWVAVALASGPDSAAACSACGRDIPSAFADPDESGGGLLGLDDPKPGFVASSLASCCEWRAAGCCVHMTLLQAVSVLLCAPLQLLYRYVYELM
jgi:hypothetical protein